MTEVTMGIIIFLLGVTVTTIIHFLNEVNELKADIESISNELNFLDKTLNERIKNEISN